MPAEWHPHRRCWMAWPSNVEAYGGRIEAAKVAWANVARAISLFEPVVMLANDADLVAARTLCGPAIEVRRIPIDDGWFRDNGPTFVLDGLGSLLGIDWDFNGWGGRSPYTRDRLAAAAILDQEGIAVRTGHHCAQPVMERFGIPATVRASFAVYNTRAEVDALARGIRKVHEVFA